MLLRDHEIGYLVGPSPWRKLESFLGQIPFFFYKSSRRTCKVLGLRHVRDLDLRLRNLILVAVFIVRVYRLLIVWNDLVELWATHLERSVILVWELRLSRSEMRGLDEFLFAEFLRLVVKYFLDTMFAGALTTWNLNHRFSKLVEFLYWRCQMIELITFFKIWEMLHKIRRWLSGGRDLFIQPTVSMQRKLLRFVRPPCWLGRLVSLRGALLLHSPIVV